MPTFTSEDYRREADKARTLHLMTIHGPTLAAMLDAAAEMAQPKTCATCRFWQTDENYTLRHYCDNGAVWAMFYKCKEFTPPVDFGCTLWTPRQQGVTP